MSALDAHLYELLHVGNPGDVEFYLQQSEGAASVLELGAGFGRILSKLNVSRAIGIDIDPELTARSPVSVLPGDMRNFDLGERFDRIYAPYSVIWCLLGVDDKRRCFECVARHLVPDGRFVFDVWTADQMHDTATDDGDSEFDLIETVFDGAQNWEVYEKDTYDPIAQRLDVTYLFVPERGENVEQQILEHYMRSDQLVALLESAGLSVTLFGDFDGRPFAYDADRLIVEATLR